MLKFCRQIIIFLKYITYSYKTFCYCSMEWPTCFDLNLIKHISDPDNIWSEMTFDNCTFWISQRFDNNHSCFLRIIHLNENSLPSSKFLLLLLLVGIKIVLYSIALYPCNISKNFKFFSFECFCFILFFTMMALSREWSKW